jgi:hypothetical protein
MSCRQMRNQLRKILENSDIPIDELALDVFRESIHELGSVKHSHALSKLDKAQILTNSIDENQLHDLYQRMSSIFKSGTFHGKAYTLTGFNRVTRNVNRKISKTPNPISIYLKIDVVSSTTLLAELGRSFEEHIIKILDYSKLCFTEKTGEMIIQEGDAIYFRFSDDVYEGSNDLFQSTLKFIQWLEEYNLFYNNLEDAISLKFVGLSIPIHKDDKDNHTITERLTEFEKKFGKEDSLIIDENIWKHIPVNVNNLIRKFYISDGMFYGMYKRFSFQNSFKHVETLC